MIRGTMTAGYHGGKRQHAAAVQGASHGVGLPLASEGLDEADGSVELFGGEGGFFGAGLEADLFGGDEVKGALSTSI